MIARLCSAAALAAALFWLPVERAAAEDARVADATTIVMMFTVAPGASEADAEAQLKEMAAFIAKQPGLIDEQLLKSTFPGNKPSHIHLMRWRSQKDWEALSESDELMRMIEAKGALFDPRPAEIFVPVK